MRIGISVYEFSSGGTAPRLERQLDLVSGGLRWQISLGAALVTLDDEAFRYLLEERERQLDASPSSPRKETI